MVDRNDRASKFKLLSKIERNIEYVGIGEKLPR